MILSLLLAIPQSTTGQTGGERKLSILYTGKSLGVLGNTRFQEEHELITEQANKDSLEFKLVSHACWRLKGFTIFLPSDEPQGSELELIINQRASWESLDTLDALVSNDALLFQDPGRDKVDMMQMLRENRRSSREFPDFRPSKVQVYKTKIVVEEDTMKCFIVQEVDAIWSSDPDHWEVGEINRVDLGKKSRLFELPINHGNFSARSTVIKEIFASAKSRQGFILADLGHRYGDFDLTPEERASLDFKGLDSLNYQIVVPYQQELIIGSEVLNDIRRRHSRIQVLTANIESDIPNLFKKTLLAEYDGMTVGFIGVTEPELRDELPKEVLSHFKFLPHHEALKSAVEELNEKDVDLIVVLSNMSAAQNAALGESVRGIDFIIADFPKSNTVHTNPVYLDQLSAQTPRPGMPYYIARSNDYSMAVGRLDIFFKEIENSNAVDLESSAHQLYPVNDRILGDTSLMINLKQDIELIKRPKGELLFPAFVDIIEQEPDLQNYDATTENGRISKDLWEKFLARLVRNGAPAELSIIRRIPSFLPLIGKLHEREVRSWLWLEDEMVMMDVLGKDLARFLEVEIGDEYETSGIQGFPFRGRMFWMVMGRPLVPNAYYRIVTTDVISDGVAREYLSRGLRSHRKFILQENGSLRADNNGESLKFREYVLSELRRIRAKGKGKTHHKNIAAILRPDRPFERLVTLNFARPTLWSSINQSFKSDGYESVPESRILSDNSLVIGANGGLVMTLDQEKSSWDVGFNFAFAEQSADVGGSERQVTETADDIKANLTYRLKGKNRKALHPFLRAEYDSEFTATKNSITGLKNARQEVGRGILGLAKIPNLKWRRLEIGFTAETDFSNNNTQLGIQGRSQARFPLNKSFTVTYALRNDFNYYFDAPNDSERDLTYKYNMVHELLVPLFGDISLSVAADFFFFKGKVEINQDPGVNMLLRVGLTYDRLWKPRYQPLF
ncbi:MAG: hypothetical protein KJP00_10845 [Bacteroidia bacterium]|nr:hypothetical protein [Bacteroidia bacterium]